MKKIFSLIVRNRKTLLLSLGLAMFCLITPSFFAEAGCSFWDPISCIVDVSVGVGIRIFGLFAGILLAFFALIAGLIYSIVSGILTWAMQVCLTVPVIPEKVSVVDVGWTFTRDFANMFFILILVFIGLATILKLKEYEAKKLLPLLIMMAILINFSPVIVGMIVDVTNIITNFFVRNIDSFGTTAVLAVFDNVKAIFFESLKSFGSWGDIYVTLGHVAGAVIYGVVIILYYTFASWVLSLMVVVFTVRIVVLWILMILSPMAFLLYIFPGTKKYFREWWQNLIQWALVGIPLGFFLYLSYYILNNSLDSTLTAQNFGAEPQNSLPDVSEGGFVLRVTNSFAGLLTSMLSPMISFILLYIGYKISRKNMPAIANQIISGMEKGLKMVAMSGAGLAAGALIGGKALGGIANLSGGIARRAKRFEDFTGKAAFNVKGHRVEPLKWLVGKPFAATTSSGFSKIERSSRDLQERLKTTSANKMESDAQAMSKKTTAQMEAEAAKAASMPKGELRNAAMAKVVYGSMIGGKYEELLDNGAFGDTKTREKNVNEAVAYLYRKGIKDPARWNMNRDLMSMINPDAKQAANDFEQGEKMINEGTSRKKEAEENLAKNRNRLNEAKESGANIGEIEQEISRNETSLRESEQMIMAGEAKKKKVKDYMSDELSKIGSPEKMTKKSLQDSLTKEVIIDTFRGDQMADIAKHFGKDIVLGLQEELGKRKFEDLARKNPSLAFWTLSNSAGDLGFSTPEGAPANKTGIKEMRNRVREIRSRDREQEKRALFQEYNQDWNKLSRAYHQSTTPTSRKNLIEELAYDEKKEIPTKIETIKSTGALRLDKEFRARLDKNRNDERQVSKHIDNLSRRISAQESLIKELGDDITLQIKLGETKKAEDNKKEFDKINLELYRAKQDRTKKQEELMTIRENIKKAEERQMRGRGEKERVKTQNIERRKTEKDMTA